MIKKVLNIVVCMIFFSMFSAFAQEVDVSNINKNLTNNVETSLAAAGIAEDILKGTGLTPDEALELVEKNSFEIKAAHADMIAAKSKMHEAARALWPKLFAEGSKTEGEIMTGVEFEEKKYGMALEHTIYASGSLWSSYKQAKSQYVAAKQKYDKSSIDSFFKAVKAYYELVKASLNYTIYRELYDDVSVDFHNSDEKVKGGLITSEEAMEVRAKYNNVDFQRLSAERELDLARYKLMREISLDDPAKLTSLKDVDTAIDVSAMTLSLEDILKAAQTNRLEIKSARNMMKAGQYGRDAAKGKDSWRVDVNGFAGRSSSRYITEPEEYKNDWNAVLKITKSFGACSAEGSYAKEDTSPKLGQSDRTETTQQSARIGILDNFGKYSRINSAQADYKRAVKEYEEAEREVGVDAHEAFFDYKEAVMRLKSSFERVELAKQKAKSEGYQATLNQMPLSQAIDAKVKLADEKAAYVQALADYKVALCKLDRAIGVWGRFSKFKAIELEEK